jgi:hypothetical protein
MRSYRHITSRPPASQSDPHRQIPIRRPPVPAVAVRSTTRKRQTTQRGQILCGPVPHRQKGPTPASLWREDSALAKLRTAPGSTQQQAAVAGAHRSVRAREIWPATRPGLPAPLTYQAELYPHPRRDDQFVRPRRLAGRRLRPCPPIRLLRGIEPWAEPRVPGADRVKHARARAGFWG